MGYDFDPQYQRQLPHPGSLGAVTDGVVEAAALGTVPLPPIAIISKQIRGSTASILFVMVTLLCAHHSSNPSARSRCGAASSDIPQEHRLLARSPLGGLASAASWEAAGGTGDGEAHRHLTP